MNKTKPPLHNKFNSKDAFRIGTLGGAEALNLSHIIGTVEEGKKADLVVFDALSANLAGAIDPFQAVVFHASNADIDTVFVNGEIVKRHGKLTKMQWGPVAKDLYAKAKSIDERFPSDKSDETWRAYYDLHGPPVL